MRASKLRVVSVFCLIMVNIMDKKTANVPLEKYNLHAEGVNKLAC